MKKLTCTCGSEKEYNSIFPVEISKETRFIPLFDQSNGLSFIWFCPVCAEKLKIAWISILEITKNKNVSFSGFLGRFKDD